LYPFKRLDFLEKYGIIYFFHKDNFDDDYKSFLKPHCHLESLFFAYKP